ncbi:MAG: MarR family transcriptional regulator [Syntrophomonadaceae bacterium]|nr:MarR family transcriptional regulator [Syntrophomonadaceae bacterium]
MQKGKENQMEDYTTFICFNLKTTNKKVEKYLTSSYEEFGINVAQAFIIMTLLDRDGSTLTEIGNKAQIENSSLTTMVDKLESMKLVERKLDREDRRVIRVFLTAKGRELANRVIEAGTSFNQLLKESLGQNVESLLESLSLITKRLEKDV